MSDPKERLRAAGLLPPLPATKHCTHCREWKPRADFPPNRRVSDGLSSWCRPCHRQAIADWKAKRKAADPSWRATEYKRAWARQKEARHG